MAKVLLKGVSKEFGKVVAVKDFTLDIKDGEFIILVGPSGCGKTTTLRTIAGLEEASAGEIYYWIENLKNFLVDSARGLL